MDRSKTFIIILTAGLIFLSVTLLMAIIDSVSPDAQNWSMNVTDSPSYWNNIYVSDDGTLYTIGGKTIYAIDRSGNIQWSITDPDAENLFDDDQYLNIAGATADQYNTYLLISAEDSGRTRNDALLLAIAPDGKIRWHKPLGNHAYRDITTAAGNVYLYSGYKVQVYDQAGSLLWTVNSVQDTPGVDEHGCLYVINRGYDLEPQVESVRAYAANGTLLWSHNVSEYNLEWLVNACDTMPVYNNGTLYIWAPGTAIALDTDGKMKWCMGYNNGMARPLAVLSNSNGNGAGESPFDSLGRLYYSYSAPGLNTDNGKSNWIVSIVNPNGTQAASFVVTDPEYKGDFYEIADGIAYYCEKNTSSQNQSFQDLYQCRINAYDMLTRNLLWSYELPALPPTTVVLNRSIARELFPWNTPDHAIEENGQVLKKSYEIPGSDINDIPWKNGSSIRIYSGNDRMYVSYWAYNYEYPVIYNSSKCVYAGAIYAIGSDGQLLWNSSTDSYVTSLGEKNGTVYYKTRSGRMSAETFDATTGIIAATAYLILRILVVGTVTRARSQLENNQNRNQINELICKHPGLTQHDLARHSGINLGTVRYHLLVLTLNHKITTYTDDTKFVRYFKNSRSYSEDEKLVIAMVRREPIRRLLTLIAEGRCSNNLGMSRELNMPESAVSKYLRELQISGVIVKSATKNEGLCYIINERYCAALKAHLTDDLDGVNRFQTSIGVE